MLGVISSFTTSHVQHRKRKLYTDCLSNRWGYAPKMVCNGVVDTDIYTGCPRRKGPNFGRVFLMLKYTDITQNTYIQS